MTSSLAFSVPSVAVSRRTYVPTAVRVTEVAGAAGSPKVAVPGPLTTVQLADRAPPCGRPSSTTLPTSAADVAGLVTMRSGPADTAGGRFAPSGGDTVTTTSSDADSAVSVAVSRRR